MSDEETRRTVELEEMFAVMPAFRSVYEDIAYDYDDLVNSNVTDPYVSSPDNSMSLEALRLYCLQHDLLQPYKTNPQHKTSNAPVQPFAVRRAA